MNLIDDDSNSNSNSRGESDTHKTIGQQRGRILKFVCHYFGHRIHYKMLKVESWDGGVVEYLVSSFLLSE